MKRKKLFLIYNPLAGKAAIKQKLSEIIDLYVKAGYQVIVYPTQGAQDAVEVVEDCDNFDLLVCCGGDGTLDEVVTGMMRRENKIPIGYIPAGSTNDFASSLHIPKNILKAASTVVTGRSFLCDIGAFNHGIFVYIAAFGLFTEVSYETNQSMKNLLGHMAYILEGVKRLTTVPSYHLKASYDGNSIEDEFIFGMITNSESVGGFKKITGKRVKLDDGIFEVTLIKKPNNPLELNSILSALLLRDIDTQYMYCFQTSHLEIISEKEMSWTLDGEFGGKHKEVIIDNYKNEIEIIVPEEKKRAVTLTN